MPIASSKMALLHHSSGSNYFALPDGTAVFLEGDHTWTNNISFSATGQFDFGAYLNVLQSEGANLIRYWMWAGSRDDGDHAGAATIQPFQQNAAGKWDLTKFNQAYFDHVAQDVDAAAAKGIYVSVMALFDYDPTGAYGWSSSVWNGNNNVNGTPTSNNAIEQADVAALPLQKAYLAKLLDTLGTKSNVLWEIANEPQNAQAVVTWENTLVDFIHQYQASHGLLAQPVGITASYPEGDQSQINPMLNATNADWIAPNGWQNYQSSPPDAVGGKVQIIDTDHTFGIGGDGNWVWEQFTRGQGGINIMDDMKGTGLGGVFAVGGANQAAEMAERLALKEVSDTVKLLNIGAMSPLDGLSSTSYALADPSKGEFVVLAPAGGSFTVDLSGASGLALQSRWIDVLGGGLSATVALTGGSAQQLFNSPSSDAVLVITPASLGSAPVTTGNPMTPVVIGTGAGTLALSVSEDAWQGDANFIVSVDGLQIGGTQTAIASHTSGASQIFDVLGAFGPGQHRVSVDFLNDAYGNSASTDRNLYVTAASFDGTVIPGATLTMLSAGAQSIMFSNTASGAPTIPDTAATVTLGSGSDTLALTVSEDAWLGDAQFTVSVDGVQIGGTQTSTGVRAAGVTQIFNVLGTFSAGPHTAIINFLNDAYGNSTDTDRNLYLTAATIGGKIIPGSTLTMMAGGPQSLSFTKGVAVPTPDTLSFHVSEDAWKGDAQYTVSIDGAQIGDIRTATASHGGGAIQEISVTGNWGNASHQVGITFINDAYGGTAATDRNLYVTAVALDGRTPVNAAANLMAAGTVNFMVPAEPMAKAITINLAEDFYKGDAQYAIIVDGKQVGASGAVTASNALKELQAVNLTVALSPGSHDFGVSFLNDAYGGTATSDRNLYVKNIVINGAPVSGTTASILGEGTSHFLLTIPN